MYTGPYRRPDNVSEVGDYTGVTMGDVVAIHLVGYIPPNIAKAVEVLQSTFKVQWLKGSYKSQWFP